VDRSSAYPYEHILINGNTVPIKAIVDGSQVARTSFENSLFKFLSQWINGEQSFIQSTSGSTGSPKDIIINRTQMFASARRSIDVLGLKPGMTSLLCINPDYIGGKMMVVRSLINSMPIIAIEPSSNPFLTISDQTADFAAMVPLQVYDVVRSQKRTWLDRLKVLIIGGGAPDRETVELLQPYSCICYSTYGMTETISHIALRQLNGDLKSDCYKTLPDVRIGTDSRGCLIIYSNHLPEPVHTNDLVEIRDEQSFVWLGRWDNVINTGGVKIIPEKLEADIQIILSHAGVSNRFFIASRSDPKFGMKVILLIEGAMDSVTTAQMERILTTTLPAYERPKEIFRCESFVETGNGKINRSATLKLALGNRNSSDG
jgi:o-succinylbenzoate---CoA ligase